MIEAIEELYHLADECRAWARTTQHDESDCTVAFARLADKLDQIAMRLAGEEKDQLHDGVPGNGDD